MKEIPLTQGKVALVDDEDYEWLSERKWFAHHYRGKWYAMYKTDRMHRVITGAPSNTEVDHINGDGLDNRRKNLRVCTKSQNQFNRGRNKNNKTGYKGVYLHRPSGRYSAQIMVKGRRMSLGLYDSPLEAALAYDDAAIKYHGEYANLNLPIMRFERGNRN